MIDITNKKYNKLTPIKPCGKNHKGEVIWLCRCDCGKETKVVGTCIRNSKIRSCGCLKKIGYSKTHGMKKTRFYTIWRGMQQRCYYLKNQNYKRYGGRNIKIEWPQFESFYADMYQSYVAHVDKSGEKNTTIDRIDPNKNYSRKNCRWATQKEQSNNRVNTAYITFRNQTHSISEWSEITGIKYVTLYWRLKKSKMTIAQALNMPPKDLTTELMTGEREVEEEEDTD